MTWYFFRCSCLVYPWNFFFFFKSVWLSCVSIMSLSLRASCWNTFPHSFSVLLSAVAAVLCDMLRLFHILLCRFAHIYQILSFFFCLSSHYRPWLTLAVPAALSIQVHCAHARDLSHMHKCWPDSLDVSQGQACHRRWHIDQQWPSFCAHGRQHLMINVEHKASSGADTLTACD